MTRVSEFNFPEKREKSIALDEVPASCAAGHYCWVDCRAANLTSLSDFLSRIGVDATTLDSILSDDVRPRFSLYPTCLHFILWDTRIEQGELRTAAVHVILGSRFLLTCCGSTADFVEQTHQTCREDFYAHAQSPGFLLF